MEPETVKKGFFNSRPVRLVSGALLLVVILIAVAFAAVNLLRSSRNGPIPVDIYPGAQSMKVVKTDKSDSGLYDTTDSVQQVLDFYNGRLPKDGDIEGCKKIYYDATPSEAPGHYFARCVVDNSQLDIQQTLSITINYQNNETRILIERQWGN